VLVVAGAAGALAFSGTLGQVLAVILVSLGLVLATALVFLEVGLSEDRERERSRRGELRQPSRGRRWRLERLRGRPRRPR
jgi:hypothetical protein